MYQAKWKYEGVQVYAVMVDGGQDNWRNFIRTHNLGDWINVYQTTAQHDAVVAAGRPDYRQLYDVYQTPGTLSAGQGKTNRCEKTYLSAGR